MQSVYVHMQKDTKMYPHTVRDTENLPSIAEALQYGIPLKSADDRAAMGGHQCGNGRASVRQWAGISAAMDRYQRGNGQVSTWLWEDHPF